MQWNEFTFSSPFCVFLSLFQIAPRTCLYFTNWVPKAPRCHHERLQQEGSDIAEQCLCNQRPGAAGSGSQHRLLVVLGGGSHYAFEPEHGHQDLTALRTVESLLPDWLVTRLGCTDFFTSLPFSFCLCSIWKWIMKQMLAQSLKIASPDSGRVCNTKGKVRKCLSSMFHHMLPHKVHSQHSQFCRKLTYSRVQSLPNKSSETDVISSCHRVSWWVMPAGVCVWCCVTLKW